MTRFHQFLWVLCAFAACSRAAAHPVSISEADVDMHPDHVNVVVRIMLEDLFRYHQLEVDDQLRVARADLMAAGEAHRDQVAQKFRIQREDGTWLTPEFVRMTAPEMAGEGVHVTELMGAAYTYEFNYPLPSPPAYLTLLQEFGSTDDILPAITNVTLYREGQKMGHAYSLYRDMPSTVRLDWDAPPLPADASDEEIRAWLEQEREATLGIATYGAAYSFLYIERREVRHEVLVPLLSLQTWLEILRQDEDMLTVEEQAALRDKIAPLFAEKSTVTIDGIDVTPVADRIDFYGVDFRDFAQQAPERALSVYTARVGIILRYPCKSAPSTLKVQWDMFNDYVPVVFTNVYAFNEVEQFVFEPYGPDFEWTSPGVPELPSIAAVDAPPPLPRVGVPVFSIAVALAGLVIMVLAVVRNIARLALATAVVTVVASTVLWTFRPVSMANPFATQTPIPADHAREIFRTLHENIYRAFDYGDEEQVYDALAQSVSGDLLRDLYLEIHEGLRMQEQGGAVARVETVREVSTDITPLADAPARVFRVDAVWQVEGTVEHWGHIHSRTNEYEAQFRVEAVDDAWKIVDMDVLNQSRVNFETSLRRRAA